jgi:hypothetical protein
VTRLPVSLDGDIELTHIAPSAKALETSFFESITRVGHELAEEDVSVVIEMRYYDGHEARNVALRGLRTSTLRSSELR